MQFVCGLLHSMSCLISICFMSFALCYVLTVLCLFSCFVCFALYFACSVFLYSSVYYSPLPPMSIVVYFIFVYQFTYQCHRVDSELQLINIVSYHIV